MLSVRSRPLAPFYASVAQLVEQETFNFKVVGSNPARGTNFYASVWTKDVRQTVNLLLRVSGFDPHMAHQFLWAVGRIIKDLAW
jgi:hypothetical protein